jgi:hypothetical protein
MINPYVQTSAVNIYGSGVTVEDSLLIGSQQVGLYCRHGLEVPIGSPYVVRNNRFAGSGTNLFCAGSTWTNNIRDSDGRPLSP